MSKLKSAPFKFGKKYRTAAEVADAVTNEGRSCHDFTVNPLHDSPSLSEIGERINDLQLTPRDGEAHLMQVALKAALVSAGKGRYGVGAALFHGIEGRRKLIRRAFNEREKGGKHQYCGHAETRLVIDSTRYLQDKTVQHANDVVAVNLCPCNGCLSLMVDAHFPTTLIGSIDPMTGAAFLRGKDLQIALGQPRAQVIHDLGLEYRFPDIDDAALRKEILTLSWDVFHATRKRVHHALHNGRLKE